MTPESQQAEIESLKTNAALIESRVCRLEKLADTYLETPWWKRMLFVADGWPGHGLASRPKRRPWRRWWNS